MQLKKSTPFEGVYQSVPCLLAAGIIASTTTRAAEEVKPKLEPIVVSATGMETPAPKVGSAVTVLDPAKLEERGIYDLQSALAEVPGVIATSTGGQRGALGSLFIRGTTTSESQVIVDGVRLSDSTAPLGNFLGGATLDGFDRIEVLRGPQSALYGGEAIGGVLSLGSARGQGAPGGMLRLEAGSFDSINSAARFHGEVGKLGYSVTTNFEDTQNDAPENDFRLFGSSLRLDYAANDCVNVGLTARVADSSFEAQGASVDHVDSALVTAFVEAKVAPDWMVKAIAGFYQEAYDSDSAFGNFGTDLDRTSLSVDNEVTVAEVHRLSFGGFYEQVDYTNTIGSDENRDRYGVHAGWQWQVTDQLTTYLASRWEDYAAYGDEFTYRGTVAYQFPTDTILRASYGKAFRAPTYLDLFGTAFGAGNPALSAEKSYGWDVGVEQAFGPNHRVSVAYFQNDIEDQIQSFPTPPVNVDGSTKTSGFEAALDGILFDERWNYRASYTHLERSLADQPRHVASGSIEYRPCEPWLLGIGGNYVDERSYGGAPLDDYLLFRLYGSYQWSENIRLHARVENLLDESYQLSNFGVPIEGRGMGLFAGVTWDW